VLPPDTFLYTEAPRYAAAVERFPEGATIRVASGGRSRPLAPGFAATADACVSFDGERVLFSGRQKPGDRWQIWEIALQGGPARRVISVAEDAITPFYLPGDRLVYSRRMPAGFQLIAAASGGAASLQLTYGPGNRIACDVLRDGRILFEAPHPASRGRDLYTVYSDGSGVETYRCDHDVDRSAGRELFSGDILFATAGRLARFTSARAVGLDLPAAPGEFAGPVAEMAPGEILASFRQNGAASFGLYRWNPAQGGTPNQVVGANAFQPVVVRRRATPKRHPSALGDRAGANLLCLNVYTSKLRIPEGAVRTVRVWALDDRGAATAIGQAPVAKDGSFYVQVPGERPVRFELLDAGGKTAAAEKGWFWARTGEQRVCVGCHAGPERAPENAVPEVLKSSTEPARMRIGGSR
jgi:hypothetical protein